MNWECPHCHQWNEDTVRCIACNCEAPPDPEDENDA